MDTASVHSRNYFLLGAAFANVCFAGERRNHRKSEEKAGKHLFFISGCKQGFYLDCEICNGRIMNKVGGYVS